MKNSNANEHKSLIPTLAKKVGEKSVSQTCFWWVYQPKVPESMKNVKK